MKKLIPLLALLASVSALAQVPGTSTTQDLEFWIDPAKGTDGYNCVHLETPCKTIQGALGHVPQTIDHNVIVNLMPGTYRDGANVGGFNVNSGGSLRLRGYYLKATVTGRNTGTATGGTAGSVTVNGTLIDTGGGWGTNALAGKVVEILKGTGVGQLGAIVSNTATTITIQGPWTAPNSTSTYAIQDWSANVIGSAATGATMLSATVPLTIERIRFSANSVATGISVYNIVPNQQAAITGCRFDSSNSTAQVQVGYGSRALVQQSIFSTVPRAINVVQGGVVQLAGDLMLSTPNELNVDGFTLSMATLRTLTPRNYLDRTTTSRIYEPGVAMSVLAPGAEVGNMTRFPVGTAAQRPDAGTATTGATFANLTTGTFQGSNGSAWYNFLVGAEDAGPFGVTGVTATGPMHSSGGTTPNISSDYAGANDAGILSVPDWTAFNRKLAATSADVQLYVDPTGNDLGSCTAVGTGACATIQGAIDKLPVRIQHNVAINVAAGNYGNFRALSRTQAKPGSGGGQGVGGVFLNGAMVDATLSTGSATGTASGGTTGGSNPLLFGTLVDATQTWTPGELVGYVLNITAGAGHSYFSFPIVANDATSVTVATIFYGGAPDGTSTYAIQDWGVVINSTPVNPGWNALVSGMDNFIVTGIKFNASANYGLVIENGASASCTNCAFGSAINYFQVYDTSNHTMSLTGSVLNNTGYYGILASGPSLALYVTNSLFTGTATALSLNAGQLGMFTNWISPTTYDSVDLGSMVDSAIFNTFFQGAGGTCLNMKGGLSYGGESALGTLNLGSDEMNNCALALDVWGHSTVTASALQGSGNGLGMRVFQGGTVALSGNSTITATGNEIVLGYENYTIAYLRSIEDISIFDLETGSRIYQQ